MTPLLTTIGAVIAALVTAWATVAVSRLNNRSAKDTATIAPYDSLASRVDTLEKKDGEKSKIIATLRDHLEVVIRDRDQLVSYMRELAVWMQGGRKPPAPTMPAYLAQHLDPAAFEVAHITERSHTFTQTERTIHTEEQP